MLIQLGDFQFSISTAAYNEIERISTYKFAAHQVIGSHDRLQAVGVDNETIRLTGSYFAELRSLVGSNNDDPFANLRSIAFKQEPLQLQSGDGKNHGYWVIFDLNVRGQDYIEQGALKADFTVQLRFYGRRVDSVNAIAQGAPSAPQRKIVNNSFQLLSEVSKLENLQTRVVQRATRSLLNAEKIDTTFDEINAIVANNPLDLTSVEPDISDKITQIEISNESIIADNLAIERDFTEIEERSQNIQNLSTDIAIEDVVEIDTTTEEGAEQVSEISKSSAIIDRQTERISSIKSSVGKVNNSVNTKNEQLKGITKELTPSAIGNRANTQLVKNNLGDAKMLSSEIKGLSRQKNTLVNNLNTPVREIKKQQKVITGYAEIIPS